LVLIFDLSCSLGGRAAPALAQISGSFSGRLAHRGEAVGAGVEMRLDLGARATIERPLHEGDEEVFVRAHTTGAWPAAPLADFLR
jgi:hypothetical protein